MNKSTRIGTYAIDRAMAKKSANDYFLVNRAPDIMWCATPLTEGRQSNSTHTRTHQQVNATAMILTHTAQTPVHTNQAKL